MDIGNELSQEAVEERLGQIVDPCSAANGTHFSIVEMGIVKAIEIEDGDVLVRLRVTSPSCFMLEYFFKEITTRVGALPGVSSVDVKSDGGLEWEPSMMHQGRRREYLEALDRAMPAGAKR